MRVDRLVKKYCSYFLLLGLAACSSPNNSGFQQTSDAEFIPVIENPAYKTDAGPVVSIDEYHHNFHTAQGRYKPFADLLKKDGYRIESFRSEFNDVTLATVDVLVIANAVAPQNKGIDNWVLPTYSAFSEHEIEAVYEWVEKGGALLLIADHMPFAGAAATLAKRFGIIFHDGYALGLNDDTGKMVFSDANTLATYHPITQGRNANESVQTIISFGGQAFRLKQETPYQPLLILPADIQLKLPVRAGVEFTEKTPAIPAEGLLQGATLKVGNGRIAVFGEAGMFTAQSDSTGQRWGFSHPEAEENAQFVLNTLHWFSGLLDQQPSFQEVP